jgi:quercetin dioxygenase-like cupin family protein
MKCLKTNKENKNSHSMKKTKSIVIVFAILIAYSNTINAQKTDLVFPKGEVITNNNFTGTAWLQMLVINDSTYYTSIGNVTFEPKARTNWHKHPGGQILLITDGQGYYQEKGKPAQLLQKGDVVKIPPYAEHWHGAASEHSLTHIAISPNTDKGSVVWLLPVTDEEYGRVNK